MAGETETGKEKPQDTQVAVEDLKTSEDEGSLSQILDEIQRPVFTGHPALAEGEGGETAPEKEDETPGGPGQEAGEEQDKPPEIKEPEPPKFEPKYKSHEEAEKAHAEAERKMHEATTQAAKDREARETLEQERNELLKKLSEKETPSSEKPAEEETSAAPEEVAARIETALDEISQLDPYDPEYNKKTAMAWAKAGFGGTKQPAIPDEKVLTELIDRRLQEHESARQQAEEEKRQQEQEIRTWEKAVGLAEEAGLDMKPGMPDYHLFRSVARELPEEYHSKPFQEQIDWAVKEVRRITGQMALKNEEQGNLARKAQEQNAILERGGNRPKVPKKEEKPYTLGSILNTQMEQRRI